MRKQEKGGGGRVFVLEPRDFEVHEIRRAVSRGCAREREMAGQGRKAEQEEGRGEGGMRLNAFDLRALIW